MTVVFQCKHTGRAHLGKLLGHRVAGGGEPLREILAGQFIVQVTPTCINMVGTFATVVGNNKFTWTLWEGGGGCGGGEEEFGWKKQLVTVSTSRQCQTVT